MINWVGIWVEDFVCLFVWGLLRVMIYGVEVSLPIRVGLNIKDN